MVEKKDLVKIRAITDYQFGRGVGSILFPDNVKIVFSPTTRRIRYIYANGKLLATLRPSDGLLALTIEGARRVKEGVGGVGLRVVVKKEAASFVAEGRSVFARHVIDVDPEIRPFSEVIVVDEDDNLLAVGKSVLSGEEMLAFKKGVAVKVRRGVGRYDEEGEA